MECLKWTLSASPIPQYLILKINKSREAVICSIPERAGDQGQEKRILWHPGSALLAPCSKQSFGSGLQCPPPYSSEDGSLDFCLQQQQNITLIADCEAFNLYLKCF